jgi:hypothetical protein
VGWRERGAQREGQDRQAGQQAETGGDPPQQAEIAHALPYF